MIYFQLIFSGNLLNNNCGSISCGEIQQRALSVSGSLPCIITCMPVLVCILKVINEYEFVKHENFLNVNCW